MATRLLLFSDLHCNAQAADNIVRLSDDSDIVIGAGDFATVRRGLRETIDLLRPIVRPCVFVPGNAETFDELAEACRGWEMAHVLHGTSAMVAGETFYGVGGAVPVTPFGDWSFDLTEEEATALLADMPSGALLVSHSPPKGVVDLSSTGSNLGSQAVRDAVLTKRPRLVVCGHIHESGGKVGQLADTPIVNAGPRGMYWTID